MAIQKLDMMNVVCRRETLDEKLRQLILLEKVEFIDSFLEINEGDFNIGISEENADEILDMEDIYPIKENKEIKQLTTRFEHTLEQLEIQPLLDKKWIQPQLNFQKLSDEIDAFCCKYAVLTEEITAVKDQIEKLNHLKIVDCMKHVEVDFSVLFDLEFFSVKFGFLTREKAKRISQNYDHIKAIALHVGTYEEKELYLILSPKSLDVEMGRILRSTDFVEMMIVPDLLGSPQMMMEKIKQRSAELTVRLSELQEMTKRELLDNQNYIHMLYSSLHLEMKMDLVRIKVAVTENLAYISAWIPRNEHESVKLALGESTQTLIDIKKSEDVNATLQVPTYLKNNRFFKPFESLVGMYGTPSHDEIDPTPFFGIAYMFLFGAMFGDLGQGLLIAVFGFLLRKRLAGGFGELLVRIGLGSMAFGILYDSFFGYEHIISKIMPSLFYLRPIDNINTMLIASIIIGLVLVFVSYLYSIINKLRLGDLEEGIFGRNGLNGLILLTTIVLMISGIFIKHELLPALFYEIIIGSCLVLLIIKQPLTNAILKKDRLYDESPGAYYVESGFDLFETLLSLLSNTISFIRIGAFALNHVGLFIAFHTLANMIGGVSGNIIMFIIGNAIIIGLEGLVVFIQGLRLFYYELFSKYYSGEGVLFTPDKF